MARSLLTVPLLVTVALAALAWGVLGPAAAFAFVALALLEIAMAADSSVPMAGIAGRLHSRPDGCSCRSASWRASWRCGSCCRRRPSPSGTPPTRRRR